MAAERVAKGVAWLDENYPGWFDVIDLDTLDIAACDRCVLGQVYEGCIPPEEKNQLIAQALQSQPKALASQFQRLAESGEVGGFTILAEAKNMVISGQVHEMGFAVDFFQEAFGSAPSYVSLLEEWTRVIIQKRLDAHSVVGPDSDLDRATAGSQ